MHSASLSDALTHVSAQRKLGSCFGHPDQLALLNDRPRSTANNSLGHGPYGLTDVGRSASVSVGCDPVKPVTVRNLSTLSQDVSVSCLVFWVACGPSDDVNNCIHYWQHTMCPTSLVRRLTGYLNVILTTYLVSVLFRAMQLCTSKFPVGP